MPFPQYKIALSQRKAAIRENQGTFRKQLPKLLRTHSGQFVLIRNKRIIAYYDAAGKALQDAMRRFPNDACYSIEKVEAEPIYMGMYAHVVSRT